MRIVIETEDRAGAGAAQPAMEFNRSEASDAGPPAAALLQAVNASTSNVGDGAGNRDGTDGGGPSPELMQAVQGADAPLRGATGLYVIDGGAAPSE
jgi:hypothetical protein